MLSRGFPTAPQNSNPAQLLVPGAALLIHHPRAAALEARIPKRAAVTAAKSFSV